MPLLDVDVAVVGAGGAGLYTALTAAREGARVALISATPLAQTASYWAQGGIAAALAVDDSAEEHLADTETAGRGLTRRSAAEVLVHNAPQAVRDLEELGVRFDADRHGTLSLGLEGGHGKRRVVHAGGSATGRRVVRELSAIVASEPRITVLEAARAADLWCHDGRVAGVLFEESLAIRARATDHLRRRRRRAVVAHDEPAGLDRRGHGARPPGRRGARRPRVPAVPPDRGDRRARPRGLPGHRGHPRRGRDAHGPDGERFVEELAPRDEVALAIYTKLQETGAPSVGSTCG
jgi:L-aspartate oxidase